MACHRQIRERPRPAVCSHTLPEGLARGALSELPAAIWFTLLIGRYEDARAGAVPLGDAVDCAGEPLDVPPPCREPSDEATLMPAGPSRDRALRVQHAGGDYWFAWAPLWRYADGSARGPLAIVHQQRERLEVRALGSVRGHADHARMRLRRVGSEHVLAVEGEHCRASGECVRGVRLAYLERQRFRERPLRAASTHSCLGSAWFPLAEQQTRPLAANWERVLARTLSIGYEPAAIVVDEHIVVRDRDRRPSAPPARLFREARARLRIRLEHGELRTEGQSLWHTIQQEDAALDDREDAPAP